MKDEGVMIQLEQSRFRLSSFRLHPSSLLFHPFQKRIEDAWGRVAVPERRDATRLNRGRRVQRGVGRFNDLSAVCADDFISAKLDGDGPLGVFAQRQAWNRERGRLFLYAAGVRQHEARAAVEAQEIHVAERVNEAQVP